MTKYIIYKIYWPGKAYYYGKTKGYRKRRNRHLREMQDGTHHNWRLVNAFSKWGVPKIKPVIYCESEDDLNYNEFLILSSKGDNRRCLNIQIKLTNKLWCTN